MEGKGCCGDVSLAGETVTWQKRSLWKYQDLNSDLGVDVKSWAWWHTSVTPGRRGNGVAVMVMREVGTGRPQELGVHPGQSTSELQIQ